MKPSKPGQLVKFHTLRPDAKQNQLYIITEIKEDFERSRADIRALNTECSFIPNNTVLLDDLEVVELNSNELIGHEVTINKADYSQVTGRVIKVSEQKIILDLTRGARGVETNVWLTIKDENGKEHTGTLLMS